MHGRLCVSVPRLSKSARGSAERWVTKRLGLAGALVGVLGVGGTTSCEAVWGSLSVPAAENCVLSTNMCAANQVCNPSTQRCEDAIALSQITPAHSRTDQAGMPVTLTGANFVPGMVVKWNGTTLAPVTVDSATQLHFTAPPSTNGAWRVTIEVSNPSGVTVSRSDLYSYYSASVNFQQATPHLSRKDALLAVGVAPAVKSGRATIVYPDGNSQMRGVALSSDLKTVTDLWSNPVPILSSSLLVGELNGVYEVPPTPTHSCSRAPTPKDSPPRWCS